MTFSLLNIYTSFKVRNPPRGNNAATKTANLDPATTNHNIQFPRIKLSTVSIWGHAVA